MITLCKNILNICFTTYGVIMFWPHRPLLMCLYTKTSLWRHTPGTYVRMTSLCCNNRWICIHRHEVELSLLRVTCDFHHGRALCWHSRQPHRHKEAFICPRMFKHRSRHAARCPSGPDNKPASICAYMHECVCACVYIRLQPLHLCSGMTLTTPSTLYGFRLLVWEAGGFHFEMCWISKGHNRVQLCVSVCECALVITSWTKLGFQGCWCC